MASPFSVFRKHRKAMLAGLTILTMFGFVFLPIMLESMGARGYINPLVVKTSKYGKIYQDQLSRMVAQRQRVLSVLISALAAIGANPNQAEGYLRGLIGEATEESVVDGWLKARRAEQLGLVVSNEGIKSYLRELTRDSLKPEDLRKILNHQRVTEYQFFLALRDEILALRLREMFQSSLIGAPPAQRWDYYTRLKRQATIEVLPVAVERFLDQIADPDEATLSKFFEEHKDKIQLPYSPEPGFREPKKVNIRYFKAELEKFAAEVNDEEIKQEYEKNKDSYEQREAAQGKGSAAQKPAGEKPPAEQPSTQTPAPEKLTPETPATEKPSAEKPGLESPSGQQSSTEKPPAAETATPAPEKPPAEKAGDTGSSQQQPAGPPEGPPPKQSSPGTPAPKSAEPDDTSSARTASPFRFAAFQQGQTGGQDGDEPTEKEPAGDVNRPKGDSKPPANDVKAPLDEAKAPAAESKEPPAASKEPAAEPKPSAAEPQGPPAGPALPATGEKPGEEPSAAAAPPAGGATAKPGESGGQPKEHPSARIKEEIRSKLASEKVDAIFARLQDMMIQYGNKWRVDKAKGVDVASLPGPDFPALANENHLSWSETGLVSALQIRSLDIGGSFDRTHSFLDKVYETSLLLYRPETSFDLKGNRFLYWKVDETKERIPKLDEAGVRQRVLRAWKMVEARGVAKKEAERLAAEARKAKESLAEVFRNRADIQVTLTAPFSWLTYGNLGMLGTQVAPELSRVTGVDLPGTQFMRTVFDLQPEGIAVAMNLPQTAAYVVRMVEVAPSEEVLWRQFEAEPYWKEFDSDPYNRFAPLARDDRSETYRAWLEEIKTSAGLQWERKPDRRSEQAETPEDL